MSAQDILKPGDVLAVRLPGWFSEAIRVGEELSGKVGADNHIAVFHHWDANGTPWALEGRPGGVGWVDVRAYLSSVWSVNNCAQPGRDDASRSRVAREAEAMIGSAYDWQAIADDTLRAFRMPDLFASTFHGLVPGHLVCSSYAAFLYERAGWERPPVTDRDTEPSDWAMWAVEHQWSVTIEQLRQAVAESR